MHKSINVLKNYDGFVTTGVRVTNVPATYFKNIFR